MFAARLFPGRMFPRRLFPSVGADTGAPVVYHLKWKGRTDTALAWKPPVPPVLPSRPSNTTEIIGWKGRTRIEVEWKQRTGRENYAQQQRGPDDMIQENFPLRKNTATLTSYTFRDREGAAIDLSDYVTVELLTKMQGGTLDTVDAEFESPTLGKVKYPDYVFTTAGVWDVQFVCTDAGNNKLYGEPVQFRVVKNVNDLGLEEILIY